MNQYLIFLVAPTVICVVGVALTYLVTRRKRPTLYTDADVDQFLRDNAELMNELAELEARERR